MLRCGYLRVSAIRSTEHWPITNMAAAWQEKVDLTQSFRKISIKMPLTPKPRCASCEIRNSPIWRRGIDGEVLCNQCYLLEQTPASKETNGENGSRNNGNGGGNASNSGSHFIGTIRKSARLKPSKYRFKQHLKPLATKGKSRRVIFKKNVSFGGK